MKTISKIKCMLTCLLLCIAGNLWAQDVFVLVTDASEIKDKDEIIFVEPSRAYALSVDQQEKRRGITNFSVNGDVFNIINNNIQRFTVRTANPTKDVIVYAFYDGNGFLTCSGSAKDLTTEISSSGDITYNSTKNKKLWWTISKPKVIELGVQFQVKNYSASYYIEYYAPQNCFSSYSSGANKDPFIFKKVSSSDLQTRAVKNSLGTICLNRKATISGTAYSVAGKVISNNEPTSIVLKEVGSVIEAGVPYIYYTKDTELLIAMSGNEVSSATTSNGLIGTFASVKIQNNTDFYCILTQNKLAHCGTDCVVGAYKAYFDLRQMDEYTPSGAKPRFILTQDGVVDAIEALPSSSDSPAIYSITGTKTTQMTKGINIVKHADGTVTKVLKR